MTKKDYIKLANAFLYAKGHAAAGYIDREAEMHGVEAACIYVTAALQDDNPRFDSKRFRDAAGFPEKDWL